MKKLSQFFYTLLLSAVVTSIVGVEITQAQSGVYVGGHFRRERPSTVDILKKSGMTYVILFNINVEPNGDLTTDGELICSNGAYVFASVQPNYVADVTSLKQGITSINRVESCIGGWGNQSYFRIRDLINAQGTGSGSILYRNFAALKAAIPSMDAINNDDEHAYDVNTAVRFHVMLKDLGYQTTVAPYTNKSFWTSLITNVNAQRPGAVDRIDLQCYDGGAGNNPCDWRIGGVKLHAGLLNFDSQQTIRDKMTNWKNNCGVTGGFIWVYNDNGMRPGDYAATINSVFGVPTKNMKEAVNIFKHCNYEGFANGLEAGDYNLARLQSLGILDNDISSITALQGFEVVLYDGDNFTGASTVISGNAACLVNTSGNWNDRVTSLKVRSAGATNLAGTYYLQNRHSNLMLDVSGGTGATGDGANIQQWTPTNQTNQQFRFEHLGGGTYRIVAVHSGKVIDVDGIKKDNGSNVQQWTYYGTLNQQYIAVSTGDGYYKLIAKHCGKLIEVAGFSTTGGGNVQQWDNNNQTSGMWKLLPVQNGDGNGDGLSANYFNGMNFETLRYSTKVSSVNFDWGGGSPNAAVNADKFSARYTGQIQPRYSGEYTFYINSDNGRKVWINNQLVVDKWIDDWNIDYSGKITLTAGQKYDIKIEYFENNGGAGIKFEWSSAQQTREVVPTSQLYSNVLPTVSASVSATTAIAPANLILNATASDADGISKVDFYNGNTLLGSDNSSPYNFTWNNVGVGSYTITAMATDNKGGATLSSSVLIKVNSTTTPNQAPSVNITSPANNATYTAPASITVNANASDSDGTISNVQFYNGTTLLGSDNTSPYSITWNNVAAGTYTLTVRATDNEGAVTTSSAITIKVNTVTNPCSGVAQYVENSGYVAGSVVQNAGNKYQCKPYPYSGWCNGAAWAYAPGTGAYWGDAWTLTGACNARTADDQNSSQVFNVRPNPASDIITISSGEKVLVSVYNSMGTEVISAVPMGSEGELFIGNLSAGTYLIKISGENIQATKILIKQ